MVFDWQEIAFEITQNSGDGSQPQIGYDVVMAAEIQLVMLHIKVYGSTYGLVSKQQGGMDMLIILISVIIP